MGNPKDAKPYPIRMAEHTKDDFKKIADKEGLTMGELIQRFTKLYEIHEKEVQIKNYNELIGGNEKPPAITTEDAWGMLFGAKKRDEERAKSRSDKLKNFLES